MVSDQNRENIPGRKILKHGTAFLLFLPKEINAAIGTRVENFKNNEENALETMNL